jgi:hypothetical protein
MMALLVPAGVLAQAGTSPSPSLVAASTTAGAAGSPEGFWSGDDPAWSMTLGGDWQVTPGDSLLSATGDGPSQLRLTTEELPGGSSFDEDAGLVEERLEAAAGKDVDLDLTFRRTGIGTVARIAYPPDAQGEHSVFLFPACPDGLRTLDLTGSPSGSDVPGGPDQWDVIAASVNPCSAEPAAVLEVSPEVQALAAAYLELASASNERIDRVARPIIKGANVKVWNRVMKQIRSYRSETIEGVEALAWTPDLVPLVDEYVDATNALIDREGRFVTARMARDLEKNLKPWSAQLDAAGAAAGRLRLALGLPTLPR